MAGQNPGSPTDFQYFYEDEVYKINNRGQVVFGLVLENYEANSSDQESDIETPIQKGEIRVVWHPSGTERVISEKSVGLADRSLMPGDVVRRLIAGKDTQRGYCRDIIMNAALQVVGTKHVIPSVASERLQPLEEFTPDLAVCLDSWVGTSKAVHSKLRLVSAEGSRLEYPDLDTCPLEDYSMRRRRSTPYSSSEFYPGQVVYGPLGSLDSANWLHITKEMKAARKHKMHDHKFTVEAVMTESVSVHWQCRALCTHPSDPTTPQQPKFLVEGEDLKNLKLLNVFEPCTLQVGDRNFLTIGPEDSFVSKKQWRKQQSKGYRSLRKQAKPVKKPSKSEITSTDHVPSRPKKRASAHRKLKSNENDMEVDTADQLESLDEALKMDATCPSIKIENIGDVSLPMASSQEDTATEEKNDSGISPEPTREDTLLNGDSKSEAALNDDDSDNWENTSSDGSDTDSGATWSSRCSSAASARGKRSPQLAVRLLRGKRLKRTVRRAPPAPPPRLGDRVVVETLHTTSRANVVWQRTVRRAPPAPPPRLGDRVVVETLHTTSRANVVWQRTVRRAPPAPPPRLGDRVVVETLHTTSRANVVWQRTVRRAPPAPPPRLGDRVVVETLHTTSRANVVWQRTVRRAPPAPPPRLGDRVVVETLHTTSRANVVWQRTVRRAPPAPPPRLGDRVVVETLHTTSRANVVWQRTVRRAPPAPPPRLGDRVVVETLHTTSRANVVWQRTVRRAPPAPPPRLGDRVVVETLHTTSRANVVWQRTVRRAPPAPPPRLGDRVVVETLHTTSRANVVWQRTVRRAPPAPPPRLGDRVVVETLHTTSRANVVWQRTVRRAPPAPPPRLGDRVVVETLHTTSRANVVWQRTVRRAPPAPPPRLGDRVVVETLHTTSRANVVWQDGTIEMGIPSTQLYPIHHLDGQECFPGDFVVSGAANVEENQQLKHREYGVVQRVDHHGRTAIVHWYRTYTSADEPVPQMLHESEVSVYDLKDHPDFQYRPGTVVIRVANFTGEDANCTAGQVIDNFPSGRVKVWWVDGHTSMCWPQDLYKVGEYDSEEGELWGSEGSASEDSWETQSSAHEPDPRTPDPHTPTPPEQTPTATEVAVGSCVSCGSCTTGPGAGAPGAPPLPGGSGADVPRLLEPRVAAHIERGRIAMRKLEEMFAKHPTLQSQEVKVLSLLRLLRAPAASLEDAHVPALLRPPVGALLQRLHAHSQALQDAFRREPALHTHEIMRKLLNLYKDCRFLDRLMGTSFFHEDHFLGLLERVRERGAITPRAGERRVHEQLARLFAPSEPAAGAAPPSPPPESMLVDDDADKPPLCDVPGRPIVAANVTVEPMQVECAVSKKQLHLNIDAAQATSSDTTVAVPDSSAVGDNPPDGADAEAVQGKNVCHKLCSLIHAQLIKAHAEVSRRRPQELADFLNTVMKRNGSEENLVYHFSVQYGALVVSMAEEAEPVKLTDVKDATTATPHKMEGTGEATGELCIIIVSTELWCQYGALVVSMAEEAEPVKLTDVKDATTATPHKMEGTGEATGELCIIIVSTELWCQYGALVVSMAEEAEPVKLTDVKDATTATPHKMEGTGEATGELCIIIVSTELWCQYGALVVSMAEEAEPVKLTDVKDATTATPHKMEGTGEATGELCIIIVSTELWCQYGALVVSMAEEAEPVKLTDVKDATTATPHKMEGTGEATGELCIIIVSTELWCQYGALVVSMAEEAEPVKLTDVKDATTATPHKMEGTGEATGELCIIIVSTELWCQYGALVVSMAEEAEPVKLTDVKDATTATPHKMEGTGEATGELCIIIVSTELWCQYGALVVSMAEEAEPVKLTDVKDATTATPHKMEGTGEATVATETAPLATAEGTEETEMDTASPAAAIPVEVKEDGEGFCILESAPAAHRFRLSMLQPSEPRTFYSAVKREIKLLKSDLPPGVWVRGYEDRIDLLSVMIAGPCKTPYEGGLFVFDVQLGGEYPRAPPLCHYHSYCTDRLNPNLYEDGKVCVSLLGTWSGRGVEVWGKDSSLLQVIVSLQGLILNAEPYFNEAGYEKQKGTQQGRENSRMYNEMVLLKLVQSMTKMLMNPPEPFRAEILTHLRAASAPLCARLEGLVLLSGEGSGAGGAAAALAAPDFPLVPASRGFCLTLRSSLESFRAALRRHDIAVPPCTL
ncbi:hypothetical protein PYW07_017286 [Mythimna separata]|uniref:UBC core domain-containing protein n=2 Tax=Ditrysia TaxID=37567 RepID=A0AAD8DXL3_MYTSE|nr:hypothetical protein PYW07_017286 [Mythimna separata]